MSDRKTLSVFLKSRYAIAALCALAALFSLIILILLLRSSPPAAQQKSAPPATVLNGGKESELATIKLTPEAEKRLGIETTALEFRGVPRTLTVSGEVVIPQGQTIVVSAPMAGTLQTVAPGAGPAVGMLVRKGQPLFRLSPFLAPERDLRVQLERDLAALTERVNAARIRKERAELLAREKAGSVRAAEQAQEEFAIAETELKAARERLERLAAAPLSSGVAVTITAPINGSIQRVSATTGQATSGGTALLEIVSLAKVWIRVPVYVGDLNSVARNHGAHIHGLGDDHASNTSKKVSNN